MRGALEYNSDLFEAETLVRMAGHLRRLLEGIVADRRQRIWDLPLLTAGEERQVLVEWNDTEREYPWERSVHQLFEEQAERSPEAVRWPLERTAELP